ncbi:hypothetical protein SAMN04488005_1526 [Yoonia tamlensis]|uniref:Uncharacterized protein n=1 Tax=Yoonia tamlensis TaxID=390270 RepID=A0A1I6GER3_9RHOB|nr:hypothetical protein SAMN04488005_1526 [Yoonia tamlensis]
MVVQPMHPAPVGTKVPTQIMAAHHVAYLSDRIACLPPQVINHPILPSRAPTAARPTAGAAFPFAAPAFFETCDHDLFPTWGLDRREGHTGGAWPVAINVPPIFKRLVERARARMSKPRAKSEHPGRVPFPCMHHTEGGVVARMMCPSTSSLLGLGAWVMPRAQTCLGVVQ